MKAARLTFGSRRYAVHADSSVAEINPENEEIRTCDEMEASLVVNEVKRLRRNRNRRERDAAMRSLGLVRVRGAFGGTYWE